MKTVLSALIALSVIAAIAAPTSADPSDYVFQPVSANVRMGDGSELAVRLIHKPTGKPVGDVTLFRTRVDMSPDNMVSMTTTHTALPSTEPGVYRFRANLTHMGRWALTVVAKVPGESEPIQGTIVFKAN